MPTAALLPPVPSPLRQGFAGPADRERLTSAALAALRSIASAWQLTRHEAAALMDCSASTWARMQSGQWPGPLSQDGLTRASALIGLYKGLHLLFADGLANRWPRLPNDGPLFQGQTPIRAMIEGGIPALLETRQHIDALRGGL